MSLSTRKATFTCPTSATTGSRSSLPIRSHFLAWGSKGTGDGQFTVPAALPSGAERRRLRQRRTTRRRPVIRRRWDLSGHDWPARGTGDGEFQTWRRASPRGMVTGTSGSPTLPTIGCSGSVPRANFSGPGAALAALTASSSNPNDVAVDGQGRVYVVDTGNNRLQVFTADGQFLAQIGGIGSGSPGKFYQNRQALPSRRTAPSLSATPTASRRSASFSLPEIPLCRRSLAGRPPGRCRVAPAPPTNRVTGPRRRGPVTRGDVR